MGQPKQSTTSTSEQWSAPWADDLLEPVGGASGLDPPTTEDDVDGPPTVEVPATEQGEPASPDAAPTARIDAPDRFASVPGELEAPFVPDPLELASPFVPDPLELEAPFDAPAPVARPGGVAVVLPASVLVVDDDRTRAAQTAARLLDFGYQCRVTDPAGAAAALADHRFDAVLVEVGAGRLPLPETTLAQLDAGLVLSTSRPLHIGLDHAVEVSKPWLVEELVDGIETARREVETTLENTPTMVEPSTDRTPEAVPLPATAPFAPVAADPSERVALTERVVRARFADPKGEGYTPGRVRSATFDGQLEIEVRRAPPSDVGWLVELTLDDGRAGSFATRLSPTGPDRVVAVLSVAPVDVPFVDTWVEQAARSGAGRLPPVVFRRSAAELSAHPGPLEEVEELDRAWSVAREALDDDEAQQRFIQACVRTEQLERAVRCYRELKEAGDARAERYLQQVGTILGFYALRQVPHREKDGLSSRLKLTLGLFLLAALVLAVMASLAA